MNPKSPEAHDEKPFLGMEIDNTDILNELSGRSCCPKCNKSRKFFCYTCYVPISSLEGRIPQIRLPLKIDIIKHQREIDGKSTAGHAAVLAPGDVTIYTYPDIPDYSKQKDVVLIFPSANSEPLGSLFDRESYVYTQIDTVLENMPGYNRGTLLKHRIYETESQNKLSKLLPIQKAVFIDSTWNQSRGIYKDERISSIRSVVLQDRASQFWRHQKGSPRWYLSTIEAIYQFLLEVHLYAWGCDKKYKGPYCDHAVKLKSEDSIGTVLPYNGQYDNLLFFFKYMYEKIHELYYHSNLQAYKREM